MTPIVAIALAVLMIAIYYLTIGIPFKGHKKNGFEKIDEAYLKANGWIKDTFNQIPPYCVWENKKVKYYPTDRIAYYTNKELHVKRVAIASKSDLEQCLSDVFYNDYEAYKYP
jgi:hypothetical protein